MITHNVMQGTKEWLALRTECFTASEAAAMMSDCKYKSRRALLDEKKGVVTKIDDRTQQLFDRGHAAEESARALLEFERVEDISPAVLSNEISGMRLLASLDGMSEDSTLIFEHKLWNETLAENVENNVLEPSHYWQLEHQLLVSGAEHVLFVVSDGTIDKRKTMIYTSREERRERLIAGWLAFKEDLARHEVKAKKELVVASDPGELFPMIDCEVQGLSVISNLNEYIPAIKRLAEEQMEQVLETDQDFADRERLNKAVKAGRATLKAKAAEVEGQFESFSQFNDYVKQADSILQKLQSHGEKLVKEAKLAKKKTIIDNAQAELERYIESQFDSREGALLVDVSPQFEIAAKNKRNFDKMQDAVLGELAKVKIDVAREAKHINANLEILKTESQGFEFLFSDRETLLLKDKYVLSKLIGDRISEHKKQLAEKEAVKPTVEVPLASSPQSNKMKNYKVRVGWAGYSRGYSVYEVSAVNEQDAIDNYWAGKELDRVVVRDDTETSEFKIIE